jgi:hypothetical protein
MGVCFHSGLAFGNMEGRSFSRAFERREIALFREISYEEFEVYKTGPVNGQLSQ